MPTLLNNTYFELSGLFLAVIRNSHAKRYIEVGNIVPWAYLRLF